jgi:hypothetical protein
MKTAPKPPAIQRILLPKFTSKKAHNFFVLLSALLAGFVMTAVTARANNVLANPGFESNGGHAVAIGWTYFSPPTAPGYYGNYWVESAPPAHSGSLYWKEWGALYAAAPTNNVAGIYQDLSSAPGSAYQASGWFYTHSNDILGSDCYVWIEVAFLGASSNTLALYKSANFSASVGTDNWFQYQVTNACDLSQPVSVGDPYFTTYAVTGSVSQLVAPVGTTKVRYRFAYLQIAAEGGSCDFDDAVLDQISGPIPPVINNLYPLNAILVNPNDGLTFTANSPSGFTINSTAIKVVVNGVDVSSGLTITGTASSKNVAYHGLQSNTVYNASITVTDSFNFTATANSYFETTWIGVPPLVYIWEAEDFDFTNGLYINNPNLCNASGDPICYFGKVGVEGVDEHNTDTGSTHFYRPDDPMPTGIAGDYSRKNLVQAGRQDYRLDPFDGGEWINYTRDWQNATNWIIARLATGEGLSGSLTLSLVNPDTTTTDLGTFTIASGLGWTAFENVFLRDANGNIANVVLNGKQTLRVTSGGNLLPNFFMLAIAQVDLPIISNLYPTGSHPFEYTNTLSFTVTSQGSSFPAGQIRMNLDGSDVTSRLNITGTTSTKNVVYSGLLPNAIHTAIITATNALGHGVSVTNHFDTFSQDNFMVEAEDFDYDSGQYIPNWSPDAYANLGAVTNVDFQHTPINGEPPFTIYRSDGIQEEIARDYLRQVYIDVGGIDYHLAWYGPGDWANYTRTYPSGYFYVYLRSAGLGTYSMNLDQIVAGAGTPNQTTRRLGTWGSSGPNNQAHDWVPLTDAGLVAPVAVKLGGVNTLRITTPSGDCYPSYFMLVPAMGISVSAAKSGNNISVSFPTQAGVVYRVFYRDSLSIGNWALLTNVVGDGTTKSANDPAAGTQRFYKVVAP